MKRKRKIMEKKKERKKRMRKLGKVEIKKEELIKEIKMGDDW